MLLDANRLPQLIAGRYEVVRRLGSGSAGIVLECRDTQVGSTRVALKLFPREMTRDRRMVGRLQRELLLAFKVEHHNVVRFYDTVQDGEWFGYTMEYVEGTSLESLLRENTDFDIGTVIRVLQQICAGLDAIHIGGILHRDLKPGNILLTPEGVVKIADFGLAKETRDDFDSPVGEGLETRSITLDKRITDLGDTPGTPDFISPEYIQLGVCDERSDIYAVGVIGFELLTGRSIFPDRHLPTLLRRKVNEDPPLVSTLRRDCPSELEDIVMRAINRNPAFRFQRAREMRDALQQLRSSAGHEKLLFDSPIFRMNSTAPDPAHEAPPSMLSLVMHNTVAAFERGARILLGGLLAIIFIVVAIVFLVMNDKGAWKEYRYHIERFFYSNR